MGWGIGDADIWLLENVVWRAPYFHANSATSMTATPAFNGFNASNGTHIVDLVEIVLAVMPHHRSMMARQFINNPEKTG